jgi:DNA-directed RNA polymerase sigma subunit (sigma70/sigma32)
MSKMKTLGIEPVMSLQEVADVMGITRQRVYTIEKAALEKLSKMKQAQDMKKMYLDNDYDK